MLGYMQQGALDVQHGAADVPASCQLAPSCIPACFCCHRLPTRLTLLLGHALNACMLAANWVAPSLRVSCASFCYLEHTTVS